MFGAWDTFRSGLRHHRGGGEDEQVDAATLRSLSDETGATTFIVNPRVNDLSGLDSHYQSVSAELREQYTVRYASAGGARPHQFGSRDCAQDWRCERPNGRATAPLDSPDKSTPPAIPGPQG